MHDHSITQSILHPSENHPSVITVDTLKVNQTLHPIGVDTIPVFSWIPKSEDISQYQTAYRLIVSSSAQKAEKGEGDLWDSGKKEGPSCCSVKYKGTQLISHTSYYWRIFVWDAHGMIHRSSVSVFKTGILSSNDWKAQWIGAKNTESSRPAILLRKEFSLSGEIREALISVAGLGYFELTLNGKQPDDTLFNCCNTQYNKTVLYRTFDVTSLLQPGKNAIGAELGNGFYNEQGGVWNWSTADWRDSPKLLLQMTIYYTDGRQEIISSDSSWQATANGPTIFNSIYYGETYDAGKEIYGWQNAGFHGTDWHNAAAAAPPEGILACQLEDPIRRTECYAASKVEKLTDGSYVVTCPEMISGWARLTFHNPRPGNAITICYGEKRNSDGSVQKLGGSDGQAPDWWPERYIMSDIYIAKGAEHETFEPKFSYKGFRYIQISHYSGTLRPEYVWLFRVRNDVAITGSFTCSNPLLNDMHTAMVRTMKNNLLGKPTDTPVWEKNGWLGDCNVALDTFLYNFDFSNFLPNFIKIMEDCFCQYGLLPQMVPTANWGIQDHYVWNSVFVFAVYRLYEIYGMEDYMKEQYDVLNTYAQKVILTIRDNQWVCPDNQLGDWVSPMSGKQDVPYCESPNEGSGIVGTAYVYGMLKTMAKMARLTGHSCHTRIYDDAVSHIYEAFHKTFFNSSKGYYETAVWNPYGPNRTRFRQTSQLVALSFGLVPEEHVHTVIHSLVKDIQEKDNHLDTGCIGTKEILPVLCSFGYGELAYEIAAQTTYPSWGFMIRQGSTSLWEMWETTSRSLDHYFLGTYDQWFFSHLAGITQIENGYERFAIRPFFPRALTHVTCTLQTVRGKLESSWKKSENGCLYMNITVPFGAAAKVYLPTVHPDAVTINKLPLSDSDLIRETGTENGSLYTRLKSGSYEFMINPAGA